MPRPRRPQIERRRLSLDLPAGHATWLLHYAVDGQMTITDAAVRAIEALQQTVAADAAADVAVRQPLWEAVASDD